MHARNAGKNFLACMYGSYGLNWWIVGIRTSAAGFGASNSSDTVGIRLTATGLAEVRRYADLA